MQGPIPKAPDSQPWHRHRAPPYTLAMLHTLSRPCGPSTWHRAALPPLVARSGSLTTITGVLTLLTAGTGTLTATDTGSALLMQRQRSQNKVLSVLHEFQ